MRASLFTIVFAILLAGCGSGKTEAQVVSNRAPYLSVCKDPKAAGPLLFDSRLTDGVQTAAFYEISGKRLTKLVAFPKTWNENKDGRIPELPPEADHYMLQLGANMEGQTISSGYELIMPMKKIAIGQQMVGEDLLRLRHNGRLWTASCRQLNPERDEYRQFLAGEAQ